MVIVKLFAQPGCPVLIYHTWLNPKQNLLTQMGRGSWMLFEKGEVLNQPVPSRSLRITLKKTILFYILKVYNELGKVKRSEASSTIFSLVFEKSVG